MIKYNITLEFEHNHQIVEFDKFLNEHCKVVDAQILPDTKVLYETDPVFKSISKEYSKVKRIRNKYINDNNGSSN
jgi:hypothetical protein